MTSATFDDSNHNQLDSESKACSTLLGLPKIKARRSLDEFNQFCSFILAYEAGKENNVAVKRENDPHSPSGSSTSSVTDSLTEDHRRHSLKRPRNQPKKASDADEEYDSDDESWEEVTCYCQKPFAGRPMIECSHCLTWIHLSCAKIRKSNIPKKFTCQRCRDTHLHSSIFFSNSDAKQKTNNGKVRKKVAT